MSHIARRTPPRSTMAWVLIAAVVIGILVVMPRVARADNTDISNAVTSITANPSTINTYANGEVTVSFSADHYQNGYRIQQGDYIDVTWAANTEDAVYLLGYGMQIDVVDESDIDPDTNAPRVIGVATVSGDNLHIEFNAAASYKQKREGEVTFTVTAYSSSSESTAHSGTVTIKAGDGAVGTVTVNSPETQSDADVIIKTGTWQLIDINGDADDYDNSSYDKVQWAFRVYGDRITAASNGTITITDELPAGVTLDPDSVRINVYETDAAGTYLTGSQFGLDNAVIASQIETYAKVTYDEESRTLMLTTSGGWLRHSYGTPALAAYAGPIRVDVEFQTYIDRTTYTGGDWVENEVSYLHEHGESSDSASASASVQVPSGSGVASGINTGEIRVTKVITGSNVTIPQVTFRLYMLDGQGGSRRSDQWYTGSETLETDESGNTYIEAQTDASGVAVFGGSSNGLSDGYYQLVEVSDVSHDWLVQSSDPIDVQLVSATGHGIEQTVSNSVKTVDVTATKQWLTADGSIDEGTHPTVYFKLYRYTGDDASSATAVDADLKELPSGTTTVTWEAMAEYDTSGNEYHYLVKEVDADGNEAVPAGYENAYGTDDDGATDYLTIVNTEVEVVPKTGDESPVEAIAALSAASLAALAGGYVLRRRQAQR